MEINGEGPRLSGVYGRKARSVPGFDYSQGLKNSGLTWNDATLEKWLSGPDSVVPDAKMDFYVPKAGERRDLIAYFKLFKHGFVKRDAGKTKRSLCTQLEPARGERVFGKRCSGYGGFQALVMAAYPGKPTRCTRSWKRGSVRRGSKPGRISTPGLNRSA
jgi:hypothetical protein